MKIALMFVLVLGCAEKADDATPGSAATLAQPTPIVSNERRETDEDQDKGYIGVLTPRETAEVTAPFTTRIVKFAVKIGDTVQKDDVLGTIDDRPIREQLAIEKATLKSHQAAAAHASVEHSAAYARLRREQKAIKEGVSSQADVAAAGFDSSKAGTEVSKAMADVEEQKARISAMEKKLADTTMRAPIAGKVAMRYVEEGARVTEGQQVLRVISSGELFVKFAIPAADAKKLAPGDPIDVVFETNNIHVKGRVRNIAPELDPIAQMIVAEAELESAPAELQSGLVARITPANAKK
jgi:RND family efflux transporter MFP subunit